jgi:uncharacterized YccA/Bax inhibitor family protein
MAVLTEAIEAERGARAARVAAIGRVVTATVTIIVLVVTFTVEAGGPALDLDPLMMTAITAPRVALVGKIGKKNDALAVTERLAGLAPVAKVAKEPQSSTKMSVIDALSLCSSLQPV